MSDQDKSDLIGAMGDDDAQAFLDYMHQHDAAPTVARNVPAVLPLSQVPYAPGVTPPGQNTQTSEQPAPISTADRAFAQNFRNTPADKISYLKARYPQMDFEATSPSFDPTDLNAMGDYLRARDAGQGDRVYARPMGATAQPFQALAPAGSADGAELAKRGLDNAVPIAAGLAQAAVGARAGVGMASALKGAGEGAPGILPAITRALAKYAPLGAAGAASGSAGVGLEAGRELLGNAVPGTPAQPIDPQKIADQGAAGAATPLLFGTGASRAMAEEAGVSLSGQRGLPSRALNFMTTGTGSLFSGIPRAEIQNAVEKLPEMKEIENQGQAGVIRKVQETTDSLRDGLYRHQEQLGNQIADMLSQTTKGVNIAPARAELKATVDKLSALQGTPRWNDQTEAQLAQAQQAYRNLFQQKIPAQPPNPAAQQAIRQIKGVLADIDSQTGQVPLTDDVRKLQEMREFYANQLPELEKKFAGTPESYNELPDFVDAHHAMQIRRGLQDMANFGGMSPGNVNARGGNNALSAFDKEMQRVGSNSYNQLSKSIDDATQEAGKTLGTGSFQQLNQKYAMLKETQRYLKALTSDGMAADDKATKVLMGLGAPSNANMRYTLQQLDKEIGTNVVDSADTLRALSIFGRANARGVAQSSFGSTATEKGNRARYLGMITGGAVGHALFPENHELAALMAGAGGAMAAPLASPSALRTYMNVGRPFRAAGDAASGGFGLGLRPLHTYSNQFLLPGTLPSAWQYLKDQ